MIVLILEELKNYLCFLEKQYGWSIRIHNIDMITEKYNSYLASFSAHTNAYCRYLKSEDKIWKTCLQGKEKALRKSAGGIFYGMCHGGVGEFIIPIFYLEKSIGFISVGEFRENMKDANDKLLSIEHKYHLPIEALHEFYETSLCAEIPDINFVKITLTPAARMLELIYSLRIQMDEMRPSYLSSKTFINNKILNYIRHSYTKKITVKQIIEFCNCSESYINHLFKKMNGMSISLYINKYRVKQSESLLITTDHTIKEIAFEVGFNEYSYYSNTFKKINNITPKEFRKIHR